jgi:hypothetical protein
MRLRKISKLSEWGGMLEISWPKVERGRVWERNLLMFRGECTLLCTRHRVHRVATTSFWCAFHQDGKMSPGWLGLGYTLTPFHYIYHHVQSWCVRSSWEGRYTRPISTLPLYVLYTPQSKHDISTEICHPLKCEVQSRHNLHLSMIRYSRTL